MRNNLFLIIFFLSVFLGIGLITVFVIESENKNNLEVIKKDSYYESVESDVKKDDTDNLDKNEEPVQENDDAYMNPFLYYYDSEESQKIYEGLDEKQRNAQRFTHRVIGYKKLTDKQLENLLNVTEDTKNRQNESNWEPFKQLQAIGEIDPNFKRITLDEVKKIISDSKTPGELLYDIYLRQPYCDTYYDGNFTGLTFNLLDDDEKDSIHEVITITYYSAGNMMIDYLKYTLADNYYELLKSERLY